MNRRELRRASYIHFRASEAERQALERLCRLEQASVSETMRLALRELARQRGMWPLAAQEEAAEVQQ